jgi:hypothetical protein
MQHQLKSDNILLLVHLLFTDHKSSYFWVFMACASKKCAKILSVKGSNLIRSESLPAIFFRISTLF